MILGQKLAELLIVYPILGVCWLVGWLRSICRVFNGRLANDVPQSEVDTGHGCRKKLYVRLRWASLGSDLVFGFQPNYKPPRGRLNRSETALMHGVSTRDVQSAGQPFLVIGKALATSSKK